MQLASSDADDDARREALELCCANYPIVQPSDVRSWLPTDTDNAALLYLLYARLLMEARPATRYDAHLVESLLDELLSDGAPVSAAAVEQRCSRPHNVLSQSATDLRQSNGELLRG